MILGIDVGNYSTKCSGLNYVINSIISHSENLLHNEIELKINKKNYYIGKGDFNYTLNKSEKELYIPLMITAILNSTYDICNKVVVGLPFNQYKNNNEKLKNDILNFNYKNIKLNGINRELKIKDCLVYPECLGAYYTLNVDDCILIDIGGRTTDICFIRNGVVIKSSTVVTGSINVYSKIAKYLNSKYTLNLDVEYANRILTRGYLNVLGKAVDLSFMRDILKDEFTTINKELQLNYPVKNEKIYMLGGGSALFEYAIKSRYNAELIKDYLFANCKGFKKVGEKEWQKNYK